MKLIEFVVSKLDKDTMVTILPEDKELFPAELYQGRADKCPIELGNTEVSKATWDFASEDVPADDIVITVRITKEQLDVLCMFYASKGGVTLD